MHISAQSPRNRAVVRDRSGRRVAAATATTGLDLLSPDARPSARPVPRWRSHGVQFAARHRAVVDCNHELSAVDKGNVVLGAVMAKKASAEPTESRFQRSRRVVNSRVHNTAVATGLVRRDRAFLLEHRDGRLRTDLRYAPGDRETKYPPADYANPISGNGQPESSRRNASRVCPSLVHTDSCPKLTLANQCHPASMGLIREISYHPSRCLLRRT